jgi:hypothetical protein
MIVYDLDLVGFATLEYEAHAVALIDADRPLSLAVATQLV